MKSLFFYNPHEETLLPANTIASQFIRLLQGATVSETTSFAELLPFFISEDLINTTTIEGFWAYLHSSSDGIPLPNVPIFSSFLFIEIYCLLYSLLNCCHFSFSSVYQTKSYLGLKAIHHSRELYHVEIHLYDMGASTRDCP